MSDTRTDPNAPDVLSLTISDMHETMFEDVAKSRVFSSGSFGYNFSGKFVNKKSGEKYQVTCNVILIGSKPKAEGK